MDAEDDDLGKDLCVLEPPGKGRPCRNRRREEAPLLGVVDQAKSTYENALSYFAQQLNHLNEDAQKLFLKHREFTCRMCHMMYQSWYSTYVKLIRVIIIPTSVVFQV